MTGVYVYAQNATDIRGTGLCGDLQPYEAYFEEQKNGISMLTLRMAYDKHDKWKSIHVGNLVKAKVPVRTPPSIENNAYATTIETYKVVVNPLQRFSFVNVPITEMNGLIIDNLEIGETVAKVKNNTYKKQGGATGQVAQQNLQYLETVTVPPSLTNVESVLPSARLEYQLFTIIEVRQDLQGVYITAEHVSYQLRDNYCNFQTSNDITCAAMCVGLMEHKVSADNRFTLLTNCTEVQKGGVDFRQKNIMEVLLDPEEGICEKFGLYLIRDNFNLYALKNAGSDRGFVIEYGKNLIAVDYTENIENTYTRIIPFGYDKNGNPVYMDGTIYVDSPHINDYAAPRVLMLDCSETARESDTMTLAQVKAELRTQANNSISDGIDLPAVTMSVDFLSLGDTEEYRQYRNLDKVYMLDKVSIKFKGYNLNAEVIGVRHNILTGNLENITIGSVKQGSNIRKIASWQVPTVDGANIRLQSIRTEAIADDTITTEKVRNGSITVAKLDADHVYADMIEAEAARIQEFTAESIETDVLAAALASFSNVTAQFLDIGFAQIKDAVAQNLITKDAVADKYFIQKLQVQNLQVISQTVDNLVVKALDGNYYTLSVDGNGAVTAQQTTVTASEIASGVTQDGRRSIIETDLLASELTATNIKGANALIDKIAARRINVDSLFAREAFIGKLLTTDISGNGYLQLMVDGKIDDMVIGGRNYLRNSGDLNYKDYRIQYLSGDPAAGYAVVGETAL